MIRCKIIIESNLNHNYVLHWWLIWFHSLFWKATKNKTGFFHEKGRPEHENMYLWNISLPQSEQKKLYYNIYCMCVSIYHILPFWHSYLHPFLSPTKSPRFPTVCLRDAIISSTFPEKILSCTDLDTNTNTTNKMVVVRDMKPELIIIPVDAKTNYLFNCMQLNPSVKSTEIMLLFFSWSWQAHLTSLRNQACWMSATHFW